jgi:hypothetical protein
VTSFPKTVTLLGPQRLQPTVGPIIEDFDSPGTVSVITAGWQERESEDEELFEYVGADAVNLRLYQRALDIFQEDPELAEALHRRQRKLRDLQHLYRLRLDHLLDVVRELRHRPNVDPEILRWTSERAMSSVQALDRELLDRQAESSIEFDQRWSERERPAVRRHREEILSILSDSDIVVIAGGHVAVLLNRLRLFGIETMLADKNIVAWSAGAMVLGERVVLFHDRPPQGRGNAEVLEAGLSLYRGLIPFPHARHRLLLDQPERVMLISRRFHPLMCIAMDENALATNNGKKHEFVRAAEDSSWFLDGTAVQLGINGRIGKS